MWFPGSQDCINIIVKYWFQCNGDKKLLVWMLEARLDTLSRNEIMIEACFSLCTATAGAQNNNLDLSPIKWSKMKVWTGQNFNLIEDGPGPDSHTTPIWMLLTAGCSLTISASQVRLTDWLTDWGGEELVYVFVEIPHFARDEGRNPSKLYKSSHLQYGNISDACVNW